ncbi:TPA: pilus biosynthesis protein [Escherichia coli]|nr:pilus biosynthesis protein [Escherichia coli]HEI3504626.1 pilus biosynthesis protein [Escherichia coli]
MKYKFLVAAMLAAMPFMASSSTSVDGRAFTVNTPKVSTSGNLAGCPTLETPLKLTFTEDMKPIRGAKSYSGYYDGWLGVGTAINPWVDLLGNTRYTATEHEIHIYVEFFQNPMNRFSDKGGIFARTDENGAIYSNSQYPWQQIPALGKNVYKAVISDWKKGETKSIYLPGRDFKNVEVFYFQNNVPYWDDRNNYQKIKQRLSSLKSQYTQSDIQTRLPFEPESTSGDYAPKPGDTVRTAEALYLYQKLTRASLKESKIDYYQMRGQFTNFRDTFWTQELILFGGEGAERLRNNADISNANYLMSDSGSFANALKIESIDLKLMENKRVNVPLPKAGPSAVQEYEALTGTYIASYDRTDFAMTPEDIKACGLE